MNVSPARACVCAHACLCVCLGVTRRLKIKRPRVFCACVCVCSRGARLGPALLAVRLALARLLSARLIKLLTGLYRGAKGGNMLLPD